MSRVLVIEDDQANADLLAQALSEAGHDPIAVARLEDVDRGAAPDLVITDLIGLRAYGTDGARDIVRSVRERFPGKPIIVCTAHLGAAEDAGAIGASAVVEKPFAIDELLETITRLTT